MLLAHIQRVVKRPEAYPARLVFAPGMRPCVHQRYVIFFTARASAGADRADHPRPPGQH